MRSAAIAILAVLFGSFTLNAQQDSQTSSPQSQTVMVMPPQNGGACPLGMRVRQGTGGYVRQVRNGQPKELHGALLHLTLNGPSSGQKDTLKKTPSVADDLKITAATVTVHGWNGKSRFVPAKSGQAGPAEATRTLTVRFASPDMTEVSGELLVPGFTATTLVELNSVTYANGETWTFTGSASCKTAPDLLMLVADR